MRTTRREALQVVLAGAGGLVFGGQLLTSCAKQGGARVDESLDARDNRAAPGSLDDRDTPGAPGSLDNRDDGAASKESPLEVPVKIELTHDVICPWCRIGHHRLERALREVSRPAEVSYRPFLLDPDLPPEGADLRQRLADKYGAASLDGMFDRVTQIGRADGLTFDFAKVVRSPNTTSAHMLIEAAPAGAKASLLNRLHEAYFERGEDIGAVPVLLEHWQAVGLSRDDGERALADEALRSRVRADALAQSRAGVRGVPHFRVGERTVSGAQPVPVLVELLSS